MADKEPRKRKKRKENQKRDESEDSHQPKDKSHQESRSSSEERSHDVTHEPSIFAKSVFFILFSLLIVAVGLIFFTLHGVQRDPLDSIKEPASESGLDEQGSLHSVIPEDMPSHYDNQQPFAESDEIEPSTVQDAPDSEDSPEESASIDPSEMHPWAEHIPQEKPEEQNIFNQIYEALQEELFQDDSQDEEHEEDDDVESHAETDLDGEDYMEDSFFKIESGGNDLPEGPSPTDEDDFSVIVEDVEIPSQQSLLNLEPSEVIADSSPDAAWNTGESETLSQSLEASQTAEPFSDVPSSQPISPEQIQPIVQGLPDLVESDDDAEDDDEDGDNDVDDDGIEQLLSMDSEAEDTFEKLIANIEGSPPDESVVTSKEASTQTENLGMETIDWPEDEQKVEKQERSDIPPVETPVVSSSAADDEDDDDDDDDNERKMLKSEAVQHEDIQQIKDNIPDKHSSDAVRENVDDSEQDGDVDKSEEADSDQQNIENEPSQQTEEFDLPYENSDVTNEYDFLFKEDIDEADRIVEKSPETALKSFDMLATKYPQSPRVAFGRAKCLDKLADVQRKNTYLDQAIEAYKQVLALRNVPEALYLQAGNRCVNRLRFRGYIGKALSLQSQMADKYPDNTDIQNQLGVSYLWVGKGQIAKTVFQKVLQRKPDSGFAKVHLGFILKTEENKYQEAITLMREGIASREEGVIDGRFYFHLGDSLARVGRPKQAMLVYEEGVREGVFLSAYQRSLYNVDSLTGKPWWRPEETPYSGYLQTLEKNWLLIRNEALSLMDDDKKGFIPENEGLRDTGDWKQFELFSRGRKIEQNCRRAPRTCSLVENIPDASGCKRGQVKFSIMQPGTHVWAHTGPTNCRIRAHLGLVVPEGPRLRVANETKTWTEGKIIIFDDSFEHEVWHDGKSFRLVLIADFWHPELTPEQKASLSPI